MSFESDIDEIDTLKKQKLEEYEETFHQIINSRQSVEKTITVRILGLSFKVFKNTPLDKDQKLIDYKNKIEIEGEPQINTAPEAKKPLYLLMAALCAESPYNDPDFWELLDIKSNGDVSNIHEETVAAIKKMKKR
jgi:hypothetical protein